MWIFFDTDVEYPCKEIHMVGKFFIDVRHAKKDNVVRCISSYRPTPTSFLSEVVIHRIGHLTECRRRRGSVDGLFIFMGDVKTLNC